MSFLLNIKYCQKLFIRKGVSIIVEKGVSYHGGELTYHGGGANCCTPFVDLLCCTRPLGDGGGFFYPVPLNQQTFLQRSES